MSGATSPDTGSEGGTTPNVGLGGLDGGDGAAAWPGGDETPTASLASPSDLVEVQFGGDAAVDDDGMRLRAVSSDMMAGGGLSGAGPGSGRSSKPGWLLKVRRTPATATVVIGWSFFTDYVLLLMLVPILPLYATELGVSPAAIGVLFGLKPLAQMVANPIMGVICDHVGTRSPMVAALIALALSTILFAFSTDYYLLCLARLLQGIASSGNVVAGMAHMSRLFSGPLSSQRGAQIGRAAVGISLGVMAGAPLGGVLFEAGGKRLPFLVVAGVLVVDAIARVTLLAEPDVVRAAAVAALPKGSDDSEEDKEEKPALNLSGLAILWRLVRDYQVMAVTGVLFCGNGAIGFIEGMFPLYLAETFGLNTLEIGFIYGAETMLFSIVMPLLAARSHRYGRARVMWMGLAVLGTAIPLIPAVSHLGWVVPCWMITAVGMAGVDASCNPELADIVEKRHPGCYGKVFALANTGTSLGFVLGPVVGGAIVDASGFGLATALVGVTLLIYSPTVLHAFGYLCCRRGPPKGMHQLVEVEMPDMDAGGEHGPGAVDKADPSPLSPAEASAAAVFDVDFDIDDSSTAVQLPEGTRPFGSMRFDDGGGETAGDTVGDLARTNVSHGADAAAFVIDDGTSDSDDGDIGSGAIVA